MRFTGSSFQSSKLVIDWLAENIASTDHVFVDGTDSSFILAVYSSCARFDIKCKLTVCTSFQALRQTDENYMTYKGSKFILTSWSLEEYRNALESNSLDIPIGELSERYYFAGGSIRLFLLPTDEIVPIIDSHIDRIENISSLLKGYISDSSQTNVNSLMNVTKGITGNYINTTVISEYAMKRPSKKCNHETISLARSVLPNNPAWQGWVTELECLHTIEIGSESVEFWDKDGKSITWVKTRKEAEAYSSISELSRISSLDNTFFVPTSWNENNVDAVYICKINGERTLRILQITDSSSPHTYNLEIVVQYAQATQAATVELVILCRSCKFNSVPLPADKRIPKFIESLSNIRNNAGRKKSKSPLFRIYKLCYDNPPPRIAAINSRKRKNSDNK